MTEPVRRAPSGSDFRRVLIATSRRHLPLATLLARRFDDAGFTAAVTASPETQDRAEVDILVGLSTPMDSALAAAALGLPVLHLDPTVLDDMDIQATLASPRISTNPLIAFRLDQRPARLAMAEVLVSSESAAQIQAEVPGRRRISVGRFRVSNADPLGLLPPAARITRAGIVAEWAEGYGMSQVAPVDDGAAVSLAAVSSDPLAVLVDNRGMSGIARRVRITRAAPLRVVHVRTRS